MLECHWCNFWKEQAVSFRKDTSYIIVSFRHCCMAPPNLSPLLAEEHTKLRKWRKCDLTPQPCQGGGGGEGEKLVVSDGVKEWCQIHSVALQKIDWNQFRQHTTRCHLKKRPKHTNIMMDLSDQKHSNP